MKSINYKNRGLKIKNTIILYCCILGSTFIFAQDETFLDKLDYNLVKLKSVKHFDNIGNKQKAIETLLDLYRKKENLYLRVSDKDLKYFKVNFPKEVANTLKNANDVLNKKFIFREDWDMEKTNIAYTFKDEMDWKAIPNGDEEWCFMLNRHKYWIDLGRAYYLTADEKYAKGFIAQVNHWIKNNPLDDSLKKYSWRRIEAGIRCENWIKSFEYIKNSKYVTPQFFEKFLNALYQHGTYLNASFSNFSKTSNWGVIEFHGLFNLALFMDEFKPANQWKTDAIEKLETCIALQILDDGSHWEQSAMYHNEVLHCLMNVNLIAQRKNYNLPQALSTTTKEMALVNVKWQKPNYHQPLLGDSDDTDVRGLLTMASSLFNDPVLKSRAFEKYDYETFFVMGLENNIAYEKLTPRNPDFLSVYQQSSGDFYMRSSWKEDAAFTGFHLKKLGCGHGHDNLLHFTLFANGKDYLIDGGRYSYVNNQWREFFKSNKSHNTLGVDNLTNSIYRDSWLNTFEARSQGVYTKSTLTYDYAEAENTAYKRLADPVSMKRRMLYLKPNIWFVFDSFSANETHTYSQYFNFPNDSVEIQDGGITTTYNENNLRIQPLNNLMIKLEDSWWSPEYNLKKQNKRAEMYLNKKGFTSFISLLYFPNQMELSYKKTAVYNREDIVLADKEAEAVTVDVDGKTFTLLVVHNSPAPAVHYYKVGGVFVHGEVVLIEKNNKTKTNSIVIIKE